MKHGASYVSFNSVQSCYVTDTGEKRTAETIGNCRGNLSRIKCHPSSWNVSKWETNVNTT